MRKGDIVMLNFECPLYGYPAIFIRKRKHNGIHIDFLLEYENFRAWYLSVGDPPVGIERICRL